MFGPFERAVAGRYLRARRGERFVSIIAVFSLVGIAIGVAALIVIMSVMGGFRVELLGRILGLNGHLSIVAAGAPLRDFDPIVKTVRGLPEVVEAFPVVQGQVLVTTDHGGATGGLVRGMRQDDIRRLHIVADHLLGGSLDGFSGDDAVAIGVGLAQTLGVGVGQQVTLVSPQGSATAFGSVPRIRAYTVVAIFSVGFNEADQSFVYLPLDAAQIYFKSKEAVSQIDVFVRDADRVGVVNQEVRTALRDLPQRALIRDWTQADSALFNAVRTERAVMFFILLLINVVAAFNVVSTLIMLVKDKTRDIAVLRTIGASAGAVLRIFVMVGAAVGVMGTLIGSTIGIAFCMNIERIRHALESLTGTNVFNAEIYFLSQLPAVLNWWEVGQTVALALALSLLATIYPAWRAARTDPIQALRNE